MRRAALPTIFLLLAAGIMTAFPAAARGVGVLPEIRWDVREEKLPNGLKVLLLKDSRAPVATFMVWYRVGARNELPGATGLAHLLEHMMFKGTRRFSGKVFSNLVQRNGGRHNAFTSRDYTAYFERIAADRVGVAVELEADRMKNLLLDPKEFLLERSVVQEERRRSVDDNPVSLLWEDLRAAAYRAHPYGWPVIGWETDIRRLRVEEARRFYETYYVPNNATVVAVGDFDPDDMLAAIRKRFGPIPRGPAPPEVTSREPEQRGERRIQVKRPAKLPYFAAAYHVPTYAREDAYALDVLGEILGGGRSARLERVLRRERQLVLSIGAGYPGTSIDPDLFTVSAQPAPGVKVEDVEAAVWGEVERLKREAPSEAELARVKRRLAAEYVIGLDSQFYRAMSLGRSEISGGWRRLTTYLPKIAAVTAEDVRRVARKYLVESNRTVGILIPLPMDAKPSRRRPAGKPPGGGHIQ
ncbi:MAG: M16 family metallopeptidase [Nitrospinota bacterium]